MAESELFDLDADLFMRVRRAVGIEETRYYLSGVLVEPLSEGGARMVATDGRAMLVARDRSAKAPHRAVIALELTERPDTGAELCDDGCCAMERPDYERARLQFEAGYDMAIARIMHGEFETGRGIAHDLRCADKYPDWRRAWRSPRGSEPRKGHQAYGIQPQLLARIAGNSYVHLRARAGYPVTEVIFEGAGAIAGLIMPADLVFLDASRELADAITAAESAT